MGVFLNQALRQNQEDQRFREKINGQSENRVVGLKIYILFLTLH